MDDNAFVMKFCHQFLQPVCPNQSVRNLGVAAASTFFSYDKDSYSLLDRIITGDETWLKHVFF